MARATHQIVLSKIEAAYGVDSVPAVATPANVMLFREFNLSPIEAAVVERPRVMPWHGDVAPAGNTAQNVKFTGQVALSDSGALGTPPFWGPLLRACGMSEVIVASTSVTYRPISSGFESLSHYFFCDGTRHVSLGSRGSFEVVIEANKEPYIQFDFTGFYADPTAVALPTVANFNGWRDAPIMSSTNASMVFNSNTFAASKFRYRHGNEVVLRDVPNKRDVRIANRSPTVEVTIDKPDGVTPENFFALAANITSQLRLLVFQIAMGGGAFISIGIPYAQLMPGIRFERDGDVEQITMSFMAISPVADGEMYLAIA